MNATLTATHTITRTSTRQADIAKVKAYYEHLKAEHERAKQWNRDAMRGIQATDEPLQCERMYAEELYQKTRHQLEAVTQVLNDMGLLWHGIWRTW